MGLSLPQRSGFGLFIAKGLVALHGGQIWATSTGEGRGCTFRVRLACSLAAPAAKVSRNSVSFATLGLRTSVSFASLEALMLGEDENPVTLAATEAEATRATPAGAAAAAAAGGADLPLEWTGTAERPLVVLVVDDSAISREMMIHLLRQLCGAHAVFLQVRTWPAWKCVLHV